MKRILSLYVLIGLFSMMISADVRPPETPSPKPDAKKTVDSFLSIRLDKNAKEAKLVIPKNQLKQLRAELEQLDNEPDNNAAATTGFSRTQTIIGGLLMSLGLLFGGVWFTRSRKIDTKSGKTLVAGAVLFGVGSLATIAFGNAGPPPELRQITGKLFDKKVFGYWNTAGGKIKVQVSESSNVVELIVPEIKDDKLNKEE